MAKDDSAKSIETPIEASPSSDSGKPLDAQRVDCAERKQELFLPIHGHVELFREEVAVIDHPAFQRLRRVKQLGLAHMVFPGATHTRFEHCIGAVHVAKLIINHAKENYGLCGDASSQWKLVDIDTATARFIRLGALLHDVGHVPLGHTLEDELNHLQSHDGPHRLERVATIPYPAHEVDPSLISPRLKPSDGWTLETLVNELYRPHVKELAGSSYEAFTILKHIVCKAPKEKSEKQKWEDTAKSLGAYIILRVCRDIVGNTICADFLDYLHRDWYHIGKPLYHDRRLYQYMEVRRKKPELGVGEGEPVFVINVGASERIRHDALTDILELLNARYKLAETVLFHRTKLALTGLLDRCLLEISDLYAKAGLPAQKLQTTAEALLLEASDDGLPEVLRELADGGDVSGKTALAEIIGNETRELQAANTSQLSLGAAVPVGKLGLQKRLVLSLIERLRNRDVYTLAFKLRMADFPGAHSPHNTRIKKLLSVYSTPRTNRLDFLRKMEALCNLLPGTLVMNCPPSAEMNAKVAEVNLFVEDDVSTFIEYEKQGEPNLTRGALLAQISRFYELWAASIYVESQTWQQLSDVERKNLKSVLGEFFFLQPGSDPKIIRAQMQTSLDTLGKRRAARTGSTNPDVEPYRGSTLPSGVPFDNPKPE